MNATMLDFRTRMSEIQEAVSRRERVTVSAHGRPWAVIVAWQDAATQTPMRNLKRRRSSGVSPQIGPSLPLTAVRAAQPRMKSAVNREQSSGRRKLTLHPHIMTHKNDFA